MRSNTKLKKANTETEYTTEMLIEVKRCMDDPAYFCRNYVFIKHPIRGQILFDLYDYQEEVLSNYQTNRLNILLSARQTGKTETTAAYILWYTIFQDSKEVLIASNKSSNAKDIISKIQNAYEELPAWLKPGINANNWNKHTCEFENKSIIRAEATSESSGRGKSISLLYCDEFAFVPRHIQEEFWSAILPTLSCIVGDTKILTDNGYIEIGEFHRDRKVGEYFELSGVNVWGKNGIEPVSHGYVSPESDTLIIKTRHGLEIEVTKDHPLYALKDMNQTLPRMIPAKNLNVGDSLRIDMGMNVFGNNDYIDTEFAYILGGYTAEGWMMKNKLGYHSICVSNISDDFRYKFLTNSRIKNFHVIPSNTSKLICCSKELVNEFVICGIDPTAKCSEKTIPKLIFSSKQNVVCSYLRGLFDGDGSVTERSINLTSTSKRLIQDVQLLLNNMGIISAIYRNDSAICFERNKDRILPQGTKLKSLRDSWSLNVPLSQYEIFLNLIGFSVGYKKERANEIVEKRKQDDFKHFTVPAKYIKEKIRELILASNKTEKWFRINGIRLDKCLDGNDRKIPVKWLLKFKKLLESCMILNSIDILFFDEYLGMKQYWDSIISITPSTNKTYDFTVPQTHSFLQNGIIGSNTGGACIISSTPNGDSDKFAELWRIAELGDAIESSSENSLRFIPKWIQWDMPPGRGEQFKHDQILLLGERKWLQEYECQFLGGEGTLLDNRIIIAREKEIVAKGGNVLFSINDVPFFTQIKVGGTYLMGVDPSTGTGKDFTTIEIVEFPSLEQVMEYRSNSTRSPEIYSLMKNILKFFTNNDCEVLFSVENNGVGEGIISLYSVDETFPDKATMIHEEGKDRYGFTTTDTSKLKYSNKFKMLVETNNMLMHSLTLLKEIKNFARSGKTYNAKSGSTDDCISAYLIILRILEDLAAYDSEAYEKLYSLAVNDDDSWTNDNIEVYNAEDDGAMPFLV